MNFKDKIFPSSAWYTPTVEQTITTILVNRFIVPALELSKNKELDIHNLTDTAINYVFETQIEPLLKNKAIKDFLTFCKEERALDSSFAAGTVRAETEYIQYIVEEIPKHGFKVKVDNSFIETLKARRPAELAQARIQLLDAVFARDPHTIKNIINPLRPIIAPAEGEIIREAYTLAKLLQVPAIEELLKPKLPVTINEKSLENLATYADIERFHRSIIDYTKKTSVQPNVTKYQKAILTYPGLSDRLAKSFISNKANTYFVHPHILMETSEKSFAEVEVTIAKAITESVTDQTAISNTPNLISNLRDEFYKLARTQKKPLPSYSEFLKSKKESPSQKQEEKYITELGKGLFSLLSDKKIKTALQNKAAELIAEEKKIKLAEIENADLIEKTDKLINAVLNLSENAQGKQSIKDLTPVINSSDISPILEKFDIHAHPKQIPLLTTAVKLFSVLAPDLQFIISDSFQGVALDQNLTIDDVKKLVKELTPEQQNQFLQILIKKQDIKLVTTLIEKDPNNNNQSTISFDPDEAFKVALASGNLDIVNLLNDQYKILKDENGINGIKVATDKKYGDRNILHLYFDNTFNSPTGPDPKVVAQLLRKENNYGGSALLSDFRSGRFPGDSLTSEHQNEALLRNVFPELRIFRKHGESAIDLQHVVLNENTIFSGFAVSEDTKIKFTQVLREYALHFKNDLVLYNSFLQFYLRDFPDYNSFCESNPSPAAEKKYIELLNATLKQKFTDYNTVDSNFFPNLWPPQGVQKLFELRDTIKKELLSKAKEANILLSDQEIADAVNQILLTCGKNSPETKYKFFEYFKSKITTDTFANSFNDYLSALEGQVKGYDYKKGYLDKVPSLFNAILSSNKDHVEKALKSFDPKNQTDVDNLKIAYKLAFSFPQYPSITTLISAKIEKIPDALSLKGNYQKEACEKLSEEQRQIFFTKLFELKQGDIAIKLLKENTSFSFDATQKDKNGKTAFDYALFDNRSAEEVKFLVEKNPNIPLTNADGDTVLHQFLKFYFTKVNAKEMSDIVEHKLPQCEQQITSCEKSIQENEDKQKDLSKKWMKSDADKKTLQQIESILPILRKQLETLQKEKQEFEGKIKIPANVMSLIQFFATDKVYSQFLNQPNSENKTPWDLLPANKAGFESITALIPAPPQKQEIETPVAPARKPYSAKEDPKVIRAREKEQKFKIWKEKYNPNTSDDYQKDPEQLRGNAIKELFADLELPSKAPIKKELSLESMKQSIKGFKFSTPLSPKKAPIVSNQNDNPEDNPEQRKLEELEGNLRNFVTALKAEALVDSHAINRSIHTLYELHKYYNLLTDDERFSLSEKSSFLRDFDLRLQFTKEVLLNPTINFTRREDNKPITQQDAEDFHFAVDSNIKNIQAKRIEQMSKLSEQEVIDNPIPDQAPYSKEWIKDIIRINLSQQSDLLQPVNKSIIHIATGSPESKEAIAPVHCVVKENPANYFNILVIDTVSDLSQPRIYTTGDEATSKKQINELESSLKERGYPKPAVIYLNINPKDPNLANNGVYAAQNATDIVKQIWKRLPQTKKTDLNNRFIVDRVSILTSDNEQQVLEKIASYLQQLSRNRCAYAGNFDFEIKGLQAILKQWQEEKVLTADTRKQLENIFNIYARNTQIPLQPKPLTSEITKDLEDLCNIIPKIAKNPIENISKIKSQVEATSQLKKFYETEIAKRAHLHAFTLPTFDSLLFSTYIPVDDQSIHSAYRQLKEAHDTWQKDIAPTLARLAEELTNAELKTGKPQSVDAAINKDIDAQRLLGKHMLYKNELTSLHEKAWETRYRNFLHNNEFLLPEYDAKRYKEIFASNTPPIPRSELEKIRTILALNEKASLPKEIQIAFDKYKKIFDEYHNAFKQNNTFDEKGQGLQTAWARLYLEVSKYRDEHSQEIVPAYEPTKLNKTVFFNLNHNVWTDDYKKQFLTEEYNQVFKFLNENIALLSSDLKEVPEEFKQFLTDMHVSSNANTNLITHQLLIDLYRGMRFNGEKLSDISSEEPEKQTKDFLAFLINKLNLKTPGEQQLLCALFSVIFNQGFTQGRLTNYFGLNQSKPTEAQTFIAWINNNGYQYEVTFDEKNPNKFNIEVDYYGSQFEEEEIYKIKDPDSEEEITKIRTLIRSPQVAAKVAFSFEIKRDDQNNIIGFDYEPPEVNFMMLEKPNEAHLVFLPKPNQFVIDDVFAYGNQGIMANFVKEFGIDITDSVPNEIAAADNDPIIASFINTLRIDRAARGLSPQQCANKIVEFLKKNHTAIGEKAYPLMWAAISVHPTPEIIFDQHGELHTTAANTFTWVLNNTQKNNVLWPFYFEALLRKISAQSQKADQPSMLKFMYDASRGILLPEKIKTIDEIRPFVQLYLACKAHSDPDTTAFDQLKVQLTHLINSDVLSTLKARIEDPDPNLNVDISLILQLYEDGAIEHLAEKGETKDIIVNYLLDNHRDISLYPKLVNDKTTTKTFLGVEHNVQKTISNRLDNWLPSARLDFLTSLLESKSAIEFFFLKENHVEKFTLTELSELIISPQVSPQNLLNFFNKVPNTVSAIDPDTKVSLLNRIFADKTIQPAQKEHINFVNDRFFDGFTAPQFSPLIHNVNISTPALMSLFSHVQTLSTDVSVKDRMVLLIKVLSDNSIDQQQRLDFIKADFFTGFSDPEYFALIQHIPAQTLLPLFNKVPHAIENSSAPVKLELLAKITDAATIPADQKQNIPFITPEFSKNILAHTAKLVTETARSSGLYLANYSDELIAINELLLKWPAQGKMPEALASTLTTLQRKLETPEASLKKHLVSKTVQNSIKTLYTITDTLASLGNSSFKEQIETEVKNLKEIRDKSLDFIQNEYPHLKQNLIAPILTNKIVASEISSKSPLGIEFSNYETSTNEYQKLESQKLDEIFDLIISTSQEHGLLFADAYQKNKTKVDDICQLIEKEQIKLQEKQIPLFKNILKSRVESLQNFNAISSDQARVLASYFSDTPPTDKTFKQAVDEVLVAQELHLQKLLNNQPFSPELKAAVLNYQKFFTQFVTDTELKLNSKQYMTEWARLHSAFSKDYDALLNDPAFVPNIDEVKKDGVIFTSYNNTISNALKQDIKLIYTDLVDTLNRAAADPANAKQIITDFTAKNIKPTKAGVTDNLVLNQFIRDFYAGVIIDGVKAPYIDDNKKLEEDFLAIIKNWGFTGSDVPLVAALVSSIANQKFMQQDQLYSAFGKVASLSNGYSIEVNRDPVNPNILHFETYYGATQFPDDETSAIQHTASAQKLKVSIEIIKNGTEPVQFKLHDQDISLALFEKTNGKATLDFTNYNAWRSPLEKFDLPNPFPLNNKGLTEEFLKLLHAQNKDIPANNIPTSISKLDGDRILASFVNTLRMDLHNRKYNPDDIAQKIAAFVDTNATNHLDNLLPMIWIAHAVKPDVKINTPYQKEFGEWLIKEFVNAPEFFKKSLKEYLEANSSEQALLQSSLDEALKQNLASSHIAAIKAALNDIPLLKFTSPTYSKEDLTTLLGNCTNNYSDTNKTLLEQAMQNHNNLKVMQDWVANKTTITPAPANNLMSNSQRVAAAIFLACEKAPAPDRKTSALKYSPQQNQIREKLENILPKEKTTDDLINRAENPPKAKSKQLSPEQIKQLDQDLDLLLQLDPALKLPSSGVTGRKQKLLSSKQKVHALQHQLKNNFPAANYKDLIQKEDDVRKAVFEPAPQKTFLQRIFKPFSAAPVLDTTHVTAEQRLGLLEAAPEDQYGSIRADVFEGMNLMAFIKKFTPEQLKQIGKNPQFLGYFHTQATKLSVNEKLELLSIIAPNIAAPDESILFNNLPYTFYQNVPLIEIIKKFDTKTLTVLSNSPAFKNQYKNTLLKPSVMEVLNKDYIPFEKEEYLIENFTAEDPRNALMGGLFAKPKIEEVLPLFTTIAQAGTFTTRLPKSYFERVLNNAINWTNTSQITALSQFFNSLLQRNTRPSVSDEQLIDEFKFLRDGINASGITKNALSVLDNVMSTTIDANVPANQKFFKKVFAEFYSNPKHVVQGKTYIGIFTKFFEHMPEIFIAAPAYLNQLDQLNDPGVKALVEAALTVLPIDEAVKLANAMPKTLMSLDANSKLTLLTDMVRNNSTEKLTVNVNADQLLQDQEVLNIVAARAVNAAEYPEIQDLLTYLRNPAQSLFDTAGKSVEQRFLNEIDIRIFENSFAANVDAFLRLPNYLKRIDDLKSDRTLNVVINTLTSQYFPAEQLVKLANAMPHTFISAKPEHKLALMTKVVTEGSAEKFTFDAAAFLADVKLDAEDPHDQAIINYLKNGNSFFEGNSGKTAEAAWLKKEEKLFGLDELLNAPLETMPEDENALLGLGELLNTNLEPMARHKGTASELVKQTAKLNVAEKTTAKSEPQIPLATKVIAEETIKVDEPLPHSPTEETRASPARPASIKPARKPAPPASTNKESKKEEIAKSLSDIGVFKHPELHEPTTPMSSTSLAAPQSGDAAKEFLKKQYELYTPVRPSKTPIAKTLAVALTTSEKFSDDSIKILSSKQPQEYVAPSGNRFDLFFDETTGNLGAGIKDLKFTDKATWKAVTEMMFQLFCTNSKAVFKDEAKLEGLIISHFFLQALKQELNLRRLTSELTIGTGEDKTVIQHNNIEKHLRKRMAEADMSEETFDELKKFAEAEAKEYSKYKDTPVIKHLMRINTPSYLHAKLGLSDLSTSRPSTYGIPLTPKPTETGAAPSSPTTTPRPGFTNES